MGIKYSFFFGSFKNLLNSHNIPATTLREVNLVPALEMVPKISNLAPFRINGVTDNDYHFLL